MQAEREHNMTNLSLKSLFESNKVELEQQIAGLNLPKDLLKIQQIVSDRFSKMLEIDGAYRQNLTQSEDYILQATLNTLTEQGKYTNSLLSYLCNEHTKGNIEQYIDYRSARLTLIGTGIGSVAGGMFGIWTSVIGALVGNAIAAYLITRKGNVSDNNDNLLNNDNTIDISVFIDIISNLCGSIDGVINTYRIQVKRIINDYENKEKPSFQTEHSNLLEQIANVNKVAESTDNIPDKLKQAINLLTESLENYGLKIDNGKIINQ